MRSLSATIAAHLAARTGLHACLLVWIQAKDRDTGTPETIGFWTGEDHQQFVVDGQSRLYYGAGGLISTPPLVNEVGLKVRSHRLTFSPLAPEVAQAIRGYEPRLAPVWMHLAYFWPDTGQLVDAPVRVFRGRIEKATITTPAIGQKATCEVSLIGAATALTRPLATKKSDNALRARAPADRIRRYIDVSGQVETSWGEKRGTGPATMSPPRKTDPRGSDPRSREETLGR